MITMSDRGVGAVKEDLFDSEQDICQGKGGTTVDLFPKERLEDCGACESTTKADGQTCYCRI